LTASASRTWNSNWHVLSLSTIRHKRSSATCARRTRICRILWTPTCRKMAVAPLDATPPSTSIFGPSASFGTPKGSFSVPPPKVSTSSSSTPHPA
ncbi:hypothetical protein AAVH_38459, partial [Aphelenchoides avenae]